MRNGKKQRAKILHTAGGTATTVVYAISVWQNNTCLLQIVTSLSEQPPDLCLYIVVNSGFGIIGFKSLSSSGKLQVFFWKNIGPGLKYV